MIICDDQISLNHPRIFNLYLSLIFTSFQKINKVDNREMDNGQIYLGGYILEKVIGRGSFGCVFKAKHK